MIIANTAVFSQFASDTVSQSLKRAYSELASKAMYGVNYWIFGDDRTDIAETGGAFFGDIPDYYDVNIHNVLTENGAIKDYWRRGYSTILFCNYTIENIAESGLNDAMQNRLVAEARFIRALMYFNLANAFDSIPIHTDVYYWPLTYPLLDFNSNNFVTGPLKSLPEVYSWIKTELKAAIDYLPHRSPFDYDNRYRATWGAATALLGKIYLFESSFAKNYSADERFTGLTQKWDSAFYCLESVITSGDYYLVGSAGQTYDTWWDSTSIYPVNTPAFRYIFNVKGNGCSEFVFPAVNVSPSPNYSSYGGNAIVTWTTIRQDSCSHYTQGHGWGFNAPTLNLINLYASETGNPKDDPRYKVTVGRQGDSIITTSVNNAWCKMDFLESQGFNAACRKYECSYDEYWYNSTWTNGPIDIPVIRYSDVYLMAAEVALELGNTTTALNYVNKVRERARYSGNTGHPQDLMSISFNDVVKERALELALEGHRYYDLLRWGMAADSLDGRAIGNNTGIIAVFEEGKDEFFPTPDGVIGTYSSLVENGDKDVSIFPNPAKDFINIINLTEASTTKIIDIQGKVLMESTIDETNSKLEVGTLPAGIYYLQLINNRNFGVIKFIKN